MQRSIGKDSVEALASPVLRRIGNLERDLRIIPPCLLDHLTGLVDAQHRCARFGNFVGEVSGAANEIQNLLAGLRFEIADQAGPETEYVRMTCVICRCIPGSAHFYSLLRRGRTLTMP